MKFADTLAYLQHANFGIAPYLGQFVAPYLVDTSMKLMQYGAMGLPAVCPDVVVGSHQGRYGYGPGDRDSIVEAINGALIHGRFESASTFSWCEVTARILNPTQFEDTKLDTSKNLGIGVILD